MRGKVEGAVNNVREALKGDDLDAINKAHDTLMTEAQAIGKIVYEEVAKQSAAAANESGSADATDQSDAPSDSGDVIDAEFEVKDAK